MTPDAFAALQRALLSHAEEQTRLMREIRRGVTFLAWAIIIALAIVLGMALKH
jgi:hypothetical protein